MSVICFGDLMQLRPVSAKYVFDDINSQSSNEEVHLWRNYFNMIELTENVRQCNDFAFTNMCNRLRFGEQTDADITMLHGRIFSNDVLSAPPWNDVLWGGGQ
jgi:hypothetical protein